MTPVNDWMIYSPAPFSSELFLTDLPKAADVACLSGAKKAVWTNRVPQHEPWPRTLMADSTVDTQTDDYKKNVHHNPQYSNVGESGRKPIGKVEGDETITRGKFWRR